MRLLSIVISLLILGGWGSFSFGENVVLDTSKETKAPTESPANSQSELTAKERDAALAEFAIKEDPFKELDEMTITWERANELIKQAREQGRKEMYEAIKNDIHEKCVYQGCSFRLIPMEYLRFE